MLTQQQYDAIQAGLADLATAGVPADALAPAAKFAQDNFFALTIDSYHLDNTRMMTAVVVSDWGEQYDRWQTAAVFSGAFDLTAMWGAAGGKRLLPLGVKYALDVMPWGQSAPVQRVEYTVTGKEASPTSPATFHVDVPGGDYLGTFTGYDASGNAVAESSLPVPFHVDRGQVQTHVTYCSNSFDWTHGSGFHVARVPVERCKPRAYPRKARPWPTFDVVKAADLFLHWTVPPRPGQFYRPSRMNSGLLTTACRQGYFAEDLRNPYYPNPLVDGPRGIAIGGGATACAVGHNGGKYAWEGAGTAFVHYLTDDTRLTLAGWRDDEPIYYGDVETSPLRRMVGKWMNVPDDPQQRRFNNVWGWCWDARTTKRGASTNTLIDGNPVHDGDVRLYWADRYGSVPGKRGGRWGVIIWNGQDPNRGTPLQQEPQIWVLGTANMLCDPFGLAWDDDKEIVYCAERGADGISMLQPPSLTPLGQPFVDDSKKLGWFVQSSKSPRSYGSFADDLLRLDDAGRFEFVASPTYTLAQRQAETCIAPERVNWHAGYVTWSGKAQSAVYRAPTDTRVPQLLFTYTPGSAKYYFLNHAVSDGGAFPEWTIGVTSFDNAVQPFAKPRLHSPVSGVWSVLPWTASNANIPAGACGNGVDGGVYPMACAFSKQATGVGMFVYTDTMEGFAEITLRQPSELPADPTQMAAGSAQFRTTGLRMVVGPMFYGMVDVDVPDQLRTPELTYYETQSREEA